MIFVPSLATLRSPPCPALGASEIDGPNPWQVFFLVVLPLVPPGLAAAAILTFRIARNAVIVAHVLLGRNMRAVPVTLVDGLTGHHIDRGVVAAKGTPPAIPPQLRVRFAGRPIVTGMRAGAMKG